MRAVDALPAVARLDLSREERTVEVAVPANAAHDLIDRHLSKAALALCLGINAAAHVVECEKRVVRAFEPAQDPTHERLPSRATVIRAGDVRAHHRSIVRAPYAFTTVVLPNCVWVTVRESYTWVWPCT